MLNLKRFAALGMAAVMTMGLGMTSLAASSEPNFTVANGVYTASVTGSSTAEFEVGPANAMYQFVGYSSEKEAGLYKVDAEGKKTEDSGDTAIAINFGEDKIGNINVSPMQVGNVYASRVQVTGNGGKFGAASLKASNAEKAGASVDLTVYVEASETEKVDEADNVKVTLVDVSGLNDLVADESKTVTVQPAAKDGAGNKFKGQAGCAQTYPTAGDALYNLVGTNFEQYGGYVNSITTTVLNEEEEEETIVLVPQTIGTNYYGWNYCVIRDGKIAQGCDIVSASVFDIKTNDQVCWAYGTSAQANAYFAGLVTAN